MLFTFLGDYLSLGVLTEVLLLDHYFRFYRLYRNNVSVACYRACIHLLLPLELPAEAMDVLHKVAFDLRWSCFSTLLRQALQGVHIYYYYFHSCYHYDYKTRVGGMWSLDIKWSLSCCCCVCDMNTAEMNLEVRLVRLLLVYCTALPMMAL